MTHEFEAIAYFSNGGRLKYEAPNLEEAMTRAQFWFDLFVREWGGKSVEGDEVTSICVRKPCGTEVEYLKKK